MASRYPGARWYVAASAALILMLFSGCASYHLGAPSEPAFKTVFVPPVRNDSFMAQSRAIVTTAVREAFARDGRVSLARNPGEAERVVEVHLTDYSQATPPSPASLS